MKYFFGTSLLTCLISALANSTIKPTKEARCNVNNNYNSFYAGPNCKNRAKTRGNTTRNQGIERK